MAPRIEKESLENEKKNLDKSGQLSNASDDNNNNNSSSSSGKDQHGAADLAHVRLPIVWRNVLIFILLHAGALYGACLCWRASYATLFFGCYFLSLSFITLFLFQSSW